MPSRHWDRLAQALRDWKAAPSMRAEGFYEGAAFRAGQAVEKGPKALLRLHRREYQGHRLAATLGMLTGPLSASEGRIDAARDLEGWPPGITWGNGSSRGSPCEREARSRNEEIGAPPGSRGPQRIPGEWHWFAPPHAQTPSEDRP